MNTTNNGSEVAQLRQQIDEEYDAAHRGLYGLTSGVARHAFIHARMERISTYHRQLVHLVGENVADELLCYANDESFRRQHH